MSKRLDACKSKGFDGIDADNVNGYENDTGFNITKEDSVAYIRWIANESHRRGMAFSLKNSERLIPYVVNDVDMLQSESCVRYSNCGYASQMTQANKPVFAVEYAELISSNKFTSDACSAAEQYDFSMIYRDYMLTPQGLYRSCN